MSHFKNWPTTKTKVLTGTSARHCNESGGLKKKKKKDSERFWGASLYFCICFICILKGSKCVESHWVVI